MQYSALLIFSAAFAMSMAAPFEEASAVEVELQRALDSASAGNLLATKEDGKDMRDLIFNIAGNVLDFIKEKTQSPPSRQKNQLEEVSSAN